MKLQLIGDVHGRLSELYALCRGSQDVAQVGDLGLGFRDVNPDALPSGMKFLRGNHDSPDVARSLPGYLGEFGFWREAGAFFLSGAWSIDRPWRIEGVNWWPEEELSMAQLDAAVEMYQELKPRLVITHDCPMEIFAAMPDERKLSRQIIPTRTTQALSAMLALHAPQMWIFGHHHIAWQGEVSGTRFRCLDILESAVLDTESLLWV